MEMRSDSSAVRRPSPADAAEVVVELADSTDPLDLSDLFQARPARPLELEVGCGKGKFLLASAALQPDRDFVAIEQAASLVRKVASRAFRRELGNVRLIRADAREVLARLATASVARLHVYFPDPWPKRRHARHRFFAGETAHHVARVLTPGGQLFHATDADPYFREVVATLRQVSDLVRVTPEPFAEIPPGGFDAIFAEAGVPVFRAVWERVR